MKCFRVFSIFFFLNARKHKLSILPLKRRYRLKTIFLIHLNEFTRFVSARYVQIVKL